jgi:spore coat polysaccharide biosynthesis protein SpsF (cytidylyltransferase family)
MLAIIQARLGSKRLPGKVLMEIQGKPLLRYLIERLRGVYPVVACPLADAPRIMATVGNICRVVGVAGDENNVHERFKEVINMVDRGGDRFVRICADSPLIDPEVIKYVASHDDHTVVTNTQPRSWPAGQCVECFYMLNFLKSPNYHRFGKQPPMTDEDREHVTPWYYRNNPFLNVTNPDGDFSHVNMCVDTQEDFDRTAAVISKMTRPHWEYGWRELVDMMKYRPPEHDAWGCGKFE